MNLALYRVWSNRTVSKTLSLNASEQPLASFHLEISVDTSKFFSQITHSAERRIRLNPAHVSNEKRFAIITAASAPSVPSTK